MKTTKVFLREKKLAGGRRGLYLDFYPAIVHPETGKLTRREFLRLEVWEKPRTELEKTHNKETKALAENVRAKRQIEIQNEQYGQMADIRRSADFVTFFRQLANERKSTNHDNWISALNYLEAFTKGSLKFIELDEAFCHRFREYLLTVPSSRTKSQPLSQNSVMSYFNKFKAALKQAYKSGYLLQDLNAKVERVKPAETHRQYLSLEELQALVKTACENPILKRAALFSALTGLRFSDIQKLTWDEVRHSEASGYYLQFHQQKTGGAETHFISDQALGLLGERHETEALIFPDLHYSAWENEKLRRWMVAAGIKKNCTFHSFRHTYATLQLSSGTDIYTVSKMLGHRDLKTTQIYAKVVDEKKRAAADKIKLDL
jgi:integrase